MKNQCPLHAIDGCLAAEERQRQRTPVYCEKLPPPHTLCFSLSETLPLFIFRLSVSSPGLLFSLLGLKHHTQPSTVSGDD